MGRNGRLYPFLYPRVCNEGLAQTGESDPEGCAHGLTQEARKRLLGAVLDRRQAAPAEPRHGLVPGRQSEADRTRTAAQPGR